jgi:AmmeMemoRadiSam system protein B
MKARVLKSELAGMWYSENPRQLSCEIDSYLNAVESKQLDQVMALLVPHAGYRYSGMVAAHAMKQIEGRSFSRVIVIGPSHRVGLLDSVSIPEVSHIETPLSAVDEDDDPPELLP